MPPAPTNETPLEFNAEQDRVVSGLAAALKLAALVLLALAALRVWRGLIEFFSDFWLFLIFVVVGLLTGLLGLILISIADDARFITQTQGNDRIHLFNAVDSLNVYTKTMFWLGIVIIVVEVFALL